MGYHHVDVPYHYTQRRLRLPQVVDKQGSAQCEGDSRRLRQTSQNARCTRAFFMDHRCRKRPVPRRPLPFVDRCSPTPATRSARASKAPMRYESDAIVAMAGGKVTHFGPADRCGRSCRAARRSATTGKDTLIMAGFIDSHVHYPQTQIIGAYGEQLIDWLEQVHLRRRAAVRRPRARARGRPGVSATNACAPAPPPRRCTARCIRSRWMPSSRRPTR